MKLLEYCHQVIDLLNNSDSKSFAAIYVEKRSEVFTLYGQGLICSTVHGIDYFNNIVKYINDPDSYKETEKGNSEFETNFREILKRNK